MLYRLETLKRSIYQARGRILQESHVDELLQVVNDFIRTVETLLTHEETTVYTPPLERLGGRGRPTFSITEAQLRFLLSCGFRLRQMAEILNVSVRTLRRRMRSYNLSTRIFSQISDAELDAVTAYMVGDNEQVGSRAVRARLHSLGIQIQRRRIRSSLASDNNRSATVFDLFTEAAVHYGVPSRVRCDHGGENNSVCLFMNLYRGSDRGSAIRGRSVHNQRIERLWRDLWHGTTNVYHQLFSFFEYDGIIDVSNEMHMWALHFVYLPRINRDLQVFVEQWNNHGLRSSGHLTPRQIFVQGCIQRQDQRLTAIREIFASTDMGDSATAPALSLNESVHVPTNTFNPTQEQLQQLSEVDILEGTVGSPATTILQRVIDILQV
ncbi:hypothetical protein FQA47_002195 [Oryzias melastigma]|uniref:Integrase catalytic domain-containing protein n=1 Tax=Oryzias melastigma TaxID=30732 RepID=A0A834F4W5_ORYME|nr:hypothetical protein FQA47_002195 [Oryzias melastigma]